MEMKRAVTLKRYPNMPDMWDAANHYDGETLINVAPSVDLFAKNGTRKCYASKRRASLSFSLSMASACDG